MRRGTVFISWCTILLVSIPSIGYADGPGLSGKFVGVYGGLTIPMALTDGRGVGDLSAVRVSDIDLVNSPIYGIKVGLLPPSLYAKSPFRIETELFYTNPHAKQQDVTVSGPSGIKTRNEAGAHMRVTTWALNVVFRNPGLRFEPYAGVGLGIFWARVSGQDFATSADTSPGLNALTGARFALTERVAIFTEYKFNYAKFDWGRDVALHSVYQAHHVVGGVALGF